MAAGLENIVNEKMKERSEKVMITGDYHIPFIDEKAYSSMLSYGKKYKPDYFIINGDFLDCYSISDFDKNPARKVGLKEEIELGRKYIKDIRKAFPKAKIYFLEGNHDNRIERKLWKDSETYEVASEYFNVKDLLELDKYKIEHIKTDMDYWKKDTGHLQLGDVVIMHGDNRLNGASTSKYAGYSAKNTMMTLQSSVAINHVHRLALVNHRTPYSNLVGMECGMLAQHTGTANWQQGFVTFELVNNKSVNHRIHRIEDGILYADGKIYKSK